MPGPVHLCRFNFQDADFRRVGAVTDGGTSLSGINDPIESDGGGYWRLDATNGRTRTPADGLAWRALVEDLIGAAPLDVVICDAFHQPENHYRPHDLDPGAPAALPTSGTTFTAGAAVALRATSIRIACADPSQVQAGQTFSIQHPAWGWRAYRILSWDGTTARIRPPLREATPAGAALEFFSPRVRMHNAPGTQPSAPTNMGRYTACAVSLVEDMRKPA